MLFKVENSSHRPLLEWKGSGIVMTFSSCIGPTVINQTFCLSLIHTYRILNFVVCMNSVHYHTEIACSELVSYADLLSPVMS